MIKKHSDLYLLGVFSFVAIVAILGSIRFLDRKIAVGVMFLLGSNYTMHTVAANIPDVLFLLVSIGTATMWCVYIYLSRNGRDKNLRFLQFGGSAVPVAYLLKDILQYMFGRTNTKFWLTTGEPLRFNWFHGAGVGGFPSGHMAVFTAFGTAIWYAYPRYRCPTALGLVLLGTALIATDYHFLSDVIAGVYVGLLVTYIIRYLLKRCEIRPWI